MSSLIPTAQCFYFLVQVFQCKIARQHPGSRQEYSQNSLESCSSSFHLVNRSWLTHPALSFIPDRISTPLLASYQTPVSSVLHTTGCRQALSHLLQPANRSRDQDVPPPQSELSLLTPYNEWR